MISAVITRATSLVKYLCEHEHIPYATVQKLLRKSDIKVNGKRVNKDMDLNVGDNLIVYYQAAGLKIQYIDSNIIVINKPKGISIEGEQSLTTLLKINCTWARPCHRLDTNTDGLVIFALNPEAEAAMRVAMRTHQVVKTYSATVVGHISDSDGVIDVYMTKDSSIGVVYAHDTKVADSTFTHTEYKMVGYDEVNDTSRLLITISRGYTHQIRVAMAHIGHPIVGDGKYGDNAFNNRMNKRMQCLTASGIEFRNLPKPLDYLSQTTLTI